MDWDISDNREQDILFNAFCNSIVLFSIEIRGNTLSEIQSFYILYNNDSYKAAAPNLLSQLIDLYFNVYW